MYKTLPENFDLPSIEKKILDFWKKDNTFQKSIEYRDINKIFTFYEGPPTANGLPGIHHVISRTIKDIICRYKTMMGYRVIRKAGWDTHGLPVEVEVEKTLGIKSKAEIEKYGSIQFNNACKESIFKYLTQWEELTERMGYWINLNDAYVTFHNEYIESVWWALKTFFDKGYIYKGFKIQPFCPICESPLSSHEVAQGYQEIKEPSVYIKFKIRNSDLKDYEFLVWTTTPWTLLSNVALCVNPNAEYVCIITKNSEKLILSKERLMVIKEEYEIVKTYKGKELEYIEYEGLFDYYINSEKKLFYVTLGDFVTMDDGTGIVHIAPAYGEDDYNIGKKYDLPLIQAVDRNGKFKSEILRYINKNFKEADPSIIQDLRENGRLYKKEMFTHSYPHCWRHKVPLMYYATDSWFIKTTAYKDDMIRLNKEINWNPTEFGTGRFGNWLEENKDWALSRNRFWGTPLPIWYYIDNNGIEHYECIGSTEELKKKSLNFHKVYSEKFDLHKPYIDEVVIKSKDGIEMKRVKEVIDCWFDSGSMPFAQYHYPFENKEEFEKNFPADFIAEGLDQTRGWFYSMHAISSFLFNKPAYKNLIVNGLILDKDGKKMSKSLGNAVNPFQIMEEHGADILRWYLVVTTPVGKSKLFNNDELIEVKNKFFDTLINTYKFFIIYSNLTGFEHKITDYIPVNKRTNIDRWIISRINSLKKNYYELMNGYDIYKAGRIISDFTIDELSNWYVRRNRKRFRNPVNDDDKYSAYITLYEVLIELFKMIAPFSPFITEELYFELKNNEDSIHLNEFTDYDYKLIDSELEEQMELAQIIVYIVRSIRVKNNLKVRQPLKQIIVPILNEKIKNRLLKVKDIILEEINVKELKIIEGDSDVIVKKAKPNFKSIGPKYGKDVKKVQLIINGFTNKEISTIESSGELIIDNFKITKEDIEIYTENLKGWIVDSQDNVTVALDTTLTDALIEEGIIREFINRIQNYRKTNNFSVNDKINITLKTSDKLFDIIQKNINGIRSEIYCDNIKKYAGESVNFFKTDINNDTLEFFIEKYN